MTKKEKTIQQELAALEEIAAWFEHDADFDVEEGLKKVKEGAALAKSLKERLKAVENEFRELEAEFSEEDER